MLLASVLVSGTAIAADDVGADLVSKTVAVTPDPAHGKILYLKHCSRCHSPRAWGDGPREIPVLAGQREHYLIEQLAHFATGERNGSAMHGPAMHESLQPADVNRPQALGDLAAYLARAAGNPTPEHWGGGAVLAAGGRIYAGACSACHGSDGAGNDSGTIPAIGGQHYGYLLAQLSGFASGLRAHPQTANAVSGLPDEERQAVADYISRLPYLSSANAR